MLSPETEKQTLKDLERMIWLHFSTLNKFNTHAIRDDRVGGDERWALFRFGSIIRVIDRTCGLVRFEKFQQPKMLNHYNYPSCASLLEELKRLHPLEALADI